MVMRETRVVAPLDLLGLNVTLLAALHLSIMRPALWRTGGVVVAQQGATADEAGTSPAPAPAPAAAAPPAPAPAAAAAVAVVAQKMKRERKKLPPRKVRTQEIRRTRKTPMSEAVRQPKKVAAVADAIAVGPDHDVDWN